MEIPNIKELITKSSCRFYKYKKGVLYYSIFYDADIGRKGAGGQNHPPVKEYVFPIPVEDLGDGELELHCKSLLLMRWIRKAIEQKTLIEK